MLKENMIQEIQNLKMAGYSLNEVMAHLAAKPGKAPSLPTVRKYYNMDSVPADAHAALRKEMVFDEEPFKGAVLEILAENPGCYISSVFDVLEERYVESGEYDSLPGNAQTLRNFVHHLKASGAVDLSGGRRRTYDHVDDSNVGKQVLIDFGEQKCEGGLTVHFICLLLRYSRLFGVFAQDHKFNSEEACRAIYRFFTKCGGRPLELALDQDSVFIASEAYGEVIETRVFKDFITEQGLRLWVCNKSDPESKGPIENTVGFVKKNYFSARTITSIEEVLQTMPRWVERKNKRIHQTTFKVPAVSFVEKEKPALRPLLPSVHEAAPIALIGIEVKSQPFINYKSSKYSLPWEFCYSEVFYKAIADKLHIYDSSRKHICTHDISPVKGTFNRLPEHEKEPSSEWMAIAERMRQKYNCFDYQHFINGFRKENGRHLAKQLKAVESFLDEERPSIALVAEVMNICCRDFRYRFSQFKVVYEQVKERHAVQSAKPAADSVPKMSEVDRRSLESYQIAFEQKCAG